MAYHLKKERGPRSSCGQRASKMLAVPQDIERIPHGGARGGMGMPPLRVLFRSSPWKRG
jgi:hypothetical protein